VPRRDRHPAPAAPGTLPTLWNDDDRYVASYLTAFEGCYLTGDGGRFDEDGYLYVMGRTDDVINVAGHRLSTGSMEAVLAGHPGGRRVRGHRCRRRAQGPGAARAGRAQGGSGADPEAVRRELVQRVRDEIGPVAAFREVDVVPALPKTRSGKILRRSLRAIADGVDEPCHRPSRTRRSSTPSDRSSPAAGRSPPQGAQESPARADNER
jgi:propionyl-CoA synthetase